LHVAAYEPRLCQSVAELGSQKFRKTKKKRSLLCRRGGRHVRGSVKPSLVVKKRKKDTL